MKAREIWPEPLQVRTYQWLSLSIEIVSHQPLVVGQRSVSVLADYTFSSRRNAGLCPWAHIQEFIPYLLPDDEFTTLKRKWTPALWKFFVIFSCKPLGLALPLDTLHPSKCIPLLLFYSALCRGATEPLRLKLLNEIFPPYVMVSSSSSSIMFLPQPWAEEFGI